MKTYTQLVVDNISIPRKRFQIYFSEDKKCSLSDHSKNIFKRNILDRYTDRFCQLYANRKYLFLDYFCFSEFFSYYYKGQANLVNKNDHQPEKLLE